MVPVNKHLVPTNLTCLLWKEKFSNSIEFMDLIVLVINILGRCECIQYAFKGEM